jgi:hypothetical protein
MFQFIPPSNPPALIQVVTLYPQDSIHQGYDKNFQEQVNIAHRNVGEDFIPFKDKSTTINSYQGEINNQNRDIYIEDINGSLSDYSTQNYVTITHLITQNRTGEVREFQFSNEFSDEDLSPTLEIIPETPEDNQNILSIPIEQINVVEILADHQEYDEKTQVVTAIGNVEMRFAEAVLTADRLQVNLISRMAVAQGEVGLRRGDQLLRGTRFEYFFVQDQGVVKNASGEIYQPTLGRDLSTTSLPSRQSGGNLSPYPLSDRLLANQPLTNVTANEGYTLTVGSGQDLGLVEGKSTVGGGGQINRYRFEAEEIEFDDQGWDGKNVRITNDPFSPPELEIRADTAHYEETEPLVGVLTTTNSRVVLDQGLSLPIFQDRLVFDRRPRDPGLFSIGIDGDNRGGIFIERSFTIVNTNQVSFRVTPQYFVQKALFPDFLNLSPNDRDDGDIFRPSVFGLKLEADANIDSRTDFRGTATFTSLDLNEIENETEANLRLMHKIGDLNAPHNLSLEYNYRDRLFNGSLGFQRVQSSVGLLIASPNILLGETGINLRYQGSIQNINSDTDRLDLLSINRENNRVNLTRYQGAATLAKGFTIWQGEGLPPTPTEGLRYTPTPVIPYLQVNTGITGVSSLYSNGDTQQSVNGSIGLSGQLGNFSRSFLDYTGFNVNYSQALRGDESPFLFDRIADAKVLSWGITQQIYGPFRFGFQTALNLDTNKEISTDYILEYSRRTHNILLRYNPVLQLGALTFRISDFNWIGSADPFDGETVGDITDGVRW